MSAALCSEMTISRSGAPLFVLDMWTVLDRFLILGSSGSYYASEQETRMEHLFCILDCIDENGPRTVERICTISRAGRAPRNLPAVAALALCASAGLKQPKTNHYVSRDRTGDNPQRALTRSLALCALPEVCRIPTDLFAWCGWIRRLRGWGPGVSKAVARWYSDSPIDRLVLHGIKYESRKGFTHADLLRLSHPAIGADDIERNALVRWMLKGGISAGADARVALPEGSANTTPSGVLRQLEGAEDVLLINRSGAARASAAAEKNNAARKLRKEEGERRNSLLKAWGIDIWETSSLKSRSRDESNALFGVSSGMLAAAESMEAGAGGYLSEDDLPGKGRRSWAGDLGSHAAFGNDNAESSPQQIIQPAPSLFAPDEVSRAVDIITRCSLPHEVVPSHLKRERAVWDALLVSMPLKAIIRNLSSMTRAGLLTERSEATVFIAGRLRDPVHLHRARIHPMAVLEALEAYRAGVSRTGPSYGRRIQKPLKWTPVDEIVSALNAAFELAFQNVTPANCRLMLGMDISGSMGSAYIGSGSLTARVAAAAMCLITARTEQHREAVAYTCSSDGEHYAKFSGRFSHRLAEKKHQMAKGEVFPGLHAFPMNPDMTVGSVVKYAESLSMGATDCALPIRYALKNELAIDAFVSYTDSEHNAGPMTPRDALALYRASSGIPARLICVGMTATDYSIADPKDPLCLNVSGFDSAAPALIADFAAGRI